MKETERKYEAPTGSALPALAVLPLDGLPKVAGTSGPDEEQLEAEYYDTADLRLIRAGVTLRRREGGHDAGWHLKLPAGDDTRHEIQLPPGEEDHEVPAELAALVRASTRGEPLVPVARIATRRQRVILLGPSGESLAEIAADDVSAQTMGEATAVSRWQEVEVELTGGDRRLLDAADQQLRRDGLRPAGRSAKLERALGYQRRSPEGQQPLAPSSPAGQVVLAYLRAQVGMLTALDPMVRLDEPDAVHQMRVATRRLRATLRSFGTVIHRPATGRVAGELQWLGTVLGAARDAEVLAQHLLANVHQTPVDVLIGPVEARVQAHLAPLRAATRTAVLEALDSQRYLSLLAELDRLLAEPPVTPQAAAPAREILPGEVRRACRRTRRRMRRAWAMPAGEPRDTALHQARKAAKRARYAAEAVAPAMGTKAKRLAKQMKKAQSVLGDQHDAVVARPVERQLGISAHLAGENAFTYGLLYERDTHEAERLADRGRRVWQRASRRRYRRWLN